MGSRTDYHSFEDFIETVSASDISAESLSIKYQSPSQGKLEFAWDGDMKKEEQAIQLNNYPRYMNNYVKTSFPAGTISINYKGYSLEMNYEKLERLASEYLN
jgi:hypothetical protein